MPTAFRKEFRTEGCTAHIRRRLCGQNYYTYTIRYRRNGYNIEVTNKNLETAKTLFIEKLKTAEKVVKKGNIPITFNAFSLYYFEKFRMKKVAKSTYVSDIGRYNKYILPYFNEKEIKKITAEECQDLLEQIKSEGKGKTADEIYSLLSVIFKAAIHHSIIAKNPLDIVFHQKHQRTHGTALTKEEEKLLLDSTKGTKEHLMFAIALYTGMRPNEYETAKKVGRFIVCRNSKRKNGKEETKKIPLTPMLRPYMENIEFFEFYKPYTLREKFNAILPNHILYDLRTTFYSRLKECGVADNAIKAYVGHSLGELGNAYTDLSDEYLIREGEKFSY
ncbi:MAG: hypothetical protein DBX59_05260 [Bacillota bacterium]|nr:MAG: hypothetical protein DBX59_05260 [Bacillota bacterium]